MPAESDNLLDDSLDEILIPLGTTTTGRTLGKFQPKPRGKTGKPVTLMPVTFGEPPQPRTSSIHSYAQPNRKKQDKNDEVTSLSSALLDAGPSEIDLIDQQAQLLGDTIVHSEAPEDGNHASVDPLVEDHASVSNTNLHEVSSTFDLESFNDPVVQSTVTSDQEKLKFQPKRHLKITNPVPISSISDTSKNVSNVEPLPHASDGKCPEEDLSLSAASGSVPSTSKTLNCEDHASQEFGNCSESSPLSSDDKEACNEDQGRPGKASDMHFSMDGLDDNMQHVSTSGVNDICQDGSQAPDFGRSLQTNLDRSEEEEMILNSGIESHDHIFLQRCSAAGIRKVGKFQPKSIRPKGRQMKSVSFVLPDTGDIDPPIETHSELEDQLTGPNPSSVQMMNNEFSETIPHTTSIISDGADYQMDDSRLGTQDIAVLSGLESFDSILCEPNSLTEQPVGKFRPKLGAKTKTGKSNTSCYPLQRDFCPMNTELEEDVNLKIADLISDSGVNIGKRNSLEFSEDIEGELHCLNVEEQAEPFVSKDFEDLGARKSSRKVRKRVDVGSPSGELDGGNKEDQDIENADNFEIARDHDDDYRGEDMPKKKASRKSKKQMTEAQKPAQRRTVSKEPDSTEKEPPKKRFPHGTRRKRRQVDKTLLETPEYEIDPRQLKIKDLIQLGEARERISSKDTAPPTNNQSNENSNFFSETFDHTDPFGENHEIDEEAEHRNMLKNSRKLNYHSYMKKTQKRRWSKSETEAFYEAIRQFGTDFEMIRQLFPGTDRNQVRSKYKKEEQKNPLALADAITNRSKDNSHFEKVIELLKAKAEEESKLDDADGDPAVEAEDAIDEHEEERCKTEKEEQEANGFDGEANNSEKYSGWDGENSEKYELDGDGTSGCEDFEW